MMSYEHFGGLLQLAGGSYLVYKRIWWGVLGVLMGGWLLWPSTAGATCSDIHGYWTVSEDGPSDHQRGGNTLEVNRPTMGGGYDYSEAHLQLDPAQSWSAAGCLTIIYTVSYKIVNKGGLGVPQVAVWDSAGGEADCTGPQVCSKEGGFYRELHGPADIAFGGWINGTMIGNYDITLDSQWEVAPERMSPIIKRRLRSTANGFNLSGDALEIGAASAGALGNEPAAGLMQVMSTASKIIASWFQKALDEDPWDQNKTIYRAVVAAVPSTVTGSLNRSLVKNENILAARLTELFVATERANTAMALNDAITEGKQQDRIANLLLKIRTLLTNEANLRAKAALNFPGFASTIADPDFIADLRATVLAMS